MAFTGHFLRPGDLFCDIGANVGSYTVLASASAGADTVAFEPSLDACEWISRNIALNGLVDRVEIRNIALGSKSGTVPFTTRRGTENRVDAAGDITVSMETLDGCLPRRPAMLKIDVEGYEVEVLKGAKDVLASSALKCLVVEVTDQEAVRLLTAQGFESCGYDPRARKLLTPGREWGNVIFVRDADFVRHRLATARRMDVQGRSY